MIRPDLAEIYRSVAKELEEGTDRAVRLGPYVCNLLPDNTEAKQQYEQIFQTREHRGLFAPEWEPDEAGTYPTNANFHDRTSIRILGLCLAAVIADEGDLL